MNQQHAPHPEMLMKTPQECATQASHLCRQLNDLILEENEALSARQIKPVEENVQLKTRLATKLEKLLQEVKVNKSALQAHGDFKMMAQTIQKELDGFQTAAKKNMHLLKAAHQVRADTLQMIRHALDDQRPQAKTYNSYGQMAHGGGSSSLVNKAV